MTAEEMARERLIAYVERRTTVIFAPYHLVFLLLHSILQRILRLCVTDWHQITGNNHIVTTPCSGTNAGAAPTNVLGSTNDQ